MHEFSQIKLKYMADIFNGNSIPDEKKSEYEGKNIPYIPTKELSVEDGAINYENDLSVNDEDGFKIAPPESVLMYIEGGSTGKKIDFTDRPVVFVNKLCCIHGTTSYPKFLYHALRSKDFTEQFFLNMTGLIGGVTVSVLKNLYITLPNNIEDQQIIADHIDYKCTQIDALIANAQQQIEKLNAYKQSLITETVTKGLDPDAAMEDSGYEFIGEISQKWDICKLRHIGSTQNGISKGGEYFDSGYHFVSYGDIYRNYSLPDKVSGLIESTEAERKLYSVETGDIFFTRTSETIEEVGFSCVCEKTIPNATFAGFVIQVRPFNDKLLTSFAKYYFKSNYHRFFLAKEMNLVTRASLSQGLLKNMPILISTKDEQQQIADYLDRKCSQIDKLIAIKQQKIEKLQQYKKSLIYEYVKGKKEV